MRALILGVLGRTIRNIVFKHEYKPTYISYACLLRGTHKTNASQTGKKKITHSQTNFNACMQKLLQEMNTHRVKKIYKMYKYLYRCMLACQYSVLLRLELRVNSKIAYTI
jgi:hypothetical protein